MAAVAPGTGSRAATEAAPPTQVEPFYGPHQGGIATAQQTHTYFAALDLVTTQRADIVTLLKVWTTAAARMSEGATAQPLGEASDKPATDSAEAVGLAPARLTITFGFGPGLFEKDGHDRYGLVARRPAALTELPTFNGDQLVESRSGGDLSVQACADDPQVAFHAVRQLVRLAYGVAVLRWTQTGFLGRFPAGETPRNLMGFKDGTQNPTEEPKSPHSVTTTGATKTQNFADIVWVGDEGPAWLRGGSYAVFRRIRMALEHWDRTEIDFQEEVFGRHKYSGAPLGQTREFDPIDLDAVDKDGNSIVPDNAHVRLAAAATNDGAQILRRSYSYNDGASITAERWPPWRQGLEYDAGLLFVCYQRDPRGGFTKIFEPMSKLDALNQFTTHVGSALFACPPGVSAGGFIGQELFAAV